ncbi:MAG: bacteriocin fulvocin C-related protein [Bacteroidaceae bacterium]|nr:bacteriocin fulvocin C-related protein [Bacteroidaceae bacterium]
MKLMNVCAVVALLLMSCSSDELTYSCDKEIDRWVKSNLNEIQQMTRAEWLGLNRGYAIATYRAFTPQQKVIFWQEKLAEVKQLPWSEDELRHIEQVEQFINVHHGFFYKETLTEDENDEIDIFFYKWMQQGIENYGWDKLVALSIAATGYKVKNTLGELELPLNTYAASNISNSIEPTCDCKTGLLQNACFFSDETCVENDCSYLEDGCGWLLLQSCDGQCEPN